MQRMMVASFFEGFRGGAARAAAGPPGRRHGHAVLVAEGGGAAAEGRGSARPEWVGLCELEVRPCHARGAGRVAPYLRGLAVLPSGRRRGAARALLARCEALAASWGHGEICLDVLEDNAAAAALYASAGYERCGPSALDDLPLSDLLQGRLGRRWRKALARAGRPAAAGAAPAVAAQPEAQISDEGVQPGRGAVLAHAAGRLLREALVVALLGGAPLLGGALPQPP